MAEYIEKAELIKKLCFETAEWYYSPTIKTIKKFPSADVQPVKHGRWITWDDSGFTKCSCCNSEYYIADLQTVGDSEGFVNFCPNCGARMGLGDEKHE